MRKILFNRLTIGMIPLSYRESLTYEEQLLWLQKNLNEAIELLNQLKEDFENIDLNFDELEQKINLINEELVLVEANIKDLEDNKADKTELATSISNLDQELRELIGSEYTILKEYVDEQDENLQYQIDHFSPENISVYDPTTGLLSPIQTVIDNIYDQSRDEAITTGEFDALELTATEFDSKEITAFNFDRYGKTLLTQLLNI